MYIVDNYDKYRAYNSEHEQEIRKYEKCSCCGMRLYYETDLYEQDECYKIEDNILCEDCLTDFIKERYFMRLKENR